MSHSDKVCVTSLQTEEVEALKAIYDEDFRVVREKEKSLRITLWSDDKSLSLDLLVRTFNEMW